MLPIYLTEPCNEPARHRAAAAIARRTSSAPANPADLVRQRRRGVADIDALANGFAAVLRGRGVRVSHAANAADAAARIATLAADEPVAVTRSAVLGELHDALVGRGITVLPTYGPGNAPFAARHQRFWQLPPHQASVNWQIWSFAAAGPRRRVVGLFSANVASAATGAIYLLQHSQNLGDLLRTAHHLVLVVAIEKIAPDDAAARRQVEAVGRYGADRVLLDLSRSTPLGDPLARFPVVEGEPTVEVILLDNGRRKLLANQYRALLTCISCGACATRCPTYPEFRGPRGWNPKDYLWSHLRGDNPSVDLCTLCGNCGVDCPVDIPIPTLIAQRRAEAIATDGRGLAGWRRRLHGEVEHLDKTFSATAPLSNRALQLPLAATLRDKVFGLTPRRPVPEFRADTLERWDARRDRPRFGTPAGTRPSLVYYFGCFANYNNPEVGQATVEVLERLGYDVILPPWRCCGIPLYAKGEIEAARQRVAFNVNTLAGYIDAGHEIVTSCPSCQLALARDYPRLFPSAAAERVAAHTHFLSRFLLDRGGLGDRVAALPQRTAYHLPCHLRALGMDDDSPQLLAQIPGLRVTNVNRGCCGLSGTFGLESAHYDYAMNIGAGVFAALRDDPPDLVLTDCGACKLQIEHGSARSAVHPLEVIFRAMSAADAHSVSTGSVRRCGAAA